MTADAAESGDPGTPQDPRERAPRPPWAEFRAALDAVGFRPSRRLGQNFLLDENLARTIARDAGVEPGDFVLEVGPGCGFLSVHLAHAGARLCAVEIDPRLAPVARKFLEPYPDAEVLEADVLAGKNALAPAVLERLPREGPWRMASNLPYSVGGPVLALLAARDVPPETMTVLVQLEVAERLTAAPGTPAWGPLSIAVGVAYTGRILRPAPPGLFWPRPRVESAVVRFDLRPDRAPGEERRRLVALGRTLLQRRRQGLARVLGDALGDRAAALSLCESGGIDARRRAETLDLGELAHLAGAWREKDSP